MNHKQVFKVVGTVLQYEAFILLIPIIVSVLYKENFRDFFITFVLSFVVGTLLSMLKPEDETIQHKDGFLIVSISWIAVSFFGSLPYFFSGFANNFFDCMFESISGFTTTGATIFNNVEILPRGLVFWRSFSLWIGGMGFLIFILAMLPSMDASSFTLMKAESAGPTPSKLVPKMKETAKIMYLIYILMTIVLTILIKLSGLNWFDALIHSFSTAGTGGFSHLNSSISGYNNLFLEIVITIFTLLFGVNFELYYLLIKKQFKYVFSNEELRFYVAILSIAVILVTINVLPFYDNILETFRHSSFTVLTITASTGFSTTDFNMWPNFSRFLLLMLMITGCCSGSTSSGLKLVRVLVIYKAIKLEINKIIHPNVVKSIKINGKKIEKSTITRIFVFFIIYISTIFAGILLISIENRDFTSTATSVIATLTNAGTFFGEMTPQGTFQPFSNFSKTIFMILMMLGRLEFYPIFLLFSPYIYKVRM